MFQAVYPFILRSDLSGTILGGSGHLRVVVSASQATVDYVHTDRSVVHSYSIP